MKRHRTLGTAHAIAREPRAARRDGRRRRRQLQRLLQAAPTRSSCCCSTTPTPRRPRASFRSTRRAIAPTTTGTRSCPGSRRASSTPIRAHGPFAPERGLRFDGDKVLLDPYGLAVAVPAGYDRDAASRPGDNSATAMKSVVADPATYDWEGDQPLRTAVRRNRHLRDARRAASRGTPVPASRRRSAAPMPG